MSPTQLLSRRNLNETLFPTSTEILLQYKTNSAPCYQLEATCVLVPSCLGRHGVVFMLLSSVLCLFNFRGSTIRRSSTHRGIVGPFIFSILIWLTAWSTCGLEPHCLGCPMVESNKTLFYIFYITLLTYFMLRCFAIRHGSNNRHSCNLIFCFLTA